MVHTTRFAGVIAAAIAVSTIPGVAKAQRTQQPAHETKVGKVVEVRQQGRTRLLVVEVDGEQQEYPLTSRIELDVTGSGDTGFVRPGQYLTARGTMTNNKIFVTEVTMQLVARGQRVPPGRIVKAQAEAGQSTMSYLVSGPIIAAAPDKDYPDHTQVALKVTGPNGPIMLEPGYKVKVAGTDPQLIPAGANVNLDFVPLRGGRFNLVKATVELSDPLDSEQILGPAAPERP